MADPIEVYQTCGKCHGDGQFPNAYIDFHGDIVEPEETVDCPQCEGTGKVSCLYIHSDLADLLNDILDKCNDIFEKVNE